MRVGQGDYRYEPVRDWAKLPSGWSFGWIPAIAVDSRDRVYVHSRSEHPMVVFDRDGNFLTSWGEDLLQNAHGLRIDAEDNLYCTVWKDHCVHKLTSDGELQWTLGTPGVPRPPGLPFNLPTNLAVAPDGCLFVSDGYGNAKVHKFSPDGVLLKSWGEPGTGPGQFDLVHDVWVDSEYLVYVCDRSNNRIQIFDGEGNYLREWADPYGPDFVWFDPDETIFVADLRHRVSVLNRDGQVLSRWGEKGDDPGQFPGFPHAIWGDSRGDIYVGEVGVNGGLTKFVRV